MVVVVAVVLLLLLLLLLVRLADAFVSMPRLYCRAEVGAAGLCMDPTGDTNPSYPVGLSCVAMASRRWVVLGTSQRRRIAPARYNRRAEKRWITTHTSWPGTGSFCRPTRTARTFSGAAMAPTTPPRTVRLRGHRRRCEAAVRAGGSVRDRLGLAAWCHRCDEPRHPRSTRRWPTRVPLAFCRRTPRR